MLARAVAERWPHEGYERPEHPVQQACTEAVARWSGLDARHVVQGVDGCGVVVYALPLEAMARAYARLARAARADDDVPARVVHAMRTRPFLVGGTDRFDTVLLEETDGRVLAKVGAEGVHSVAIVDEGIGAAVKARTGRRGPSTGGAAAAADARRTARRASRAARRFHGAPRAQHARRGGRPRRTR
jgi:L-asparaginase II